MLLRRISKGIPSTMPAEQWTQSSTWNHNQSGQKPSIWEKYHHTLSRNCFIIQWETRGGLPVQSPAEPSGRKTATGEMLFDERRPAEHQ